MINAYGTIITKAFQTSLEKIRERFEEDQITESGLFLNDGLPEGIYKISPSATGVSQWDLPYSFMHKGEGVTIMDTRSFERANGTVTKAYEVDLMINRAVLEHNWNFRNEEYGPVIETLAAGYSEWIRSVIKSRSNIDAVEDTLYRIFLSFYVWQYSFDVDTLTQMGTGEVDALFSKFVIRRLRIASPLVMSVVDSEPFQELSEATERSHVDLNLVMKVANAYIDSPAVDLDKASIIQLVTTGSWMGHTSQLIAAGAVEHPALFAHMAVQATTLSLFRRTGVGRALETVGRSGFKIDSLGKWSAVLSEED